MADKKRGLGRGLSALIGDVDVGLSADPKAPTKEKSNKPPPPSSHRLKINKSLRLHIY